jgi:predicted nucleic acid-binding protein
MFDGNGTSISVKYLDTCAIVKLFVKEEGCDRFREYFYHSTNFCMTLMTFYESLNVIKRKLFSTKTLVEYSKVLEELTILGWGGRIELEDIKIYDIDVFKKIIIYSSKFGIDIGDSVQLYAILNGKYSYLVNDSSSVLITADENLSKGAKENKIRVWNILKEDKPEWLDN